MDGVILTGGGGEFVVPLIINFTTIVSNHSDIEFIEDEEEETILRHTLGWTIVLVIAYLVVFIVGCIGNVMVCVVLTLRPQMRTVTNLFIFNLAVADLFVILFCVIPTLLSNILIPWVLGSFMCKAVAYVQGVSVCASVYSLVAISLDRFLAIWFPMKMPRGLSKFQARIIILCIWVAAATIIIPWAIVFNVKENDGRSYCVETWPSYMESKIYFLIGIFLLCYALPLLFVIICNGLIWLHVAKRKVPHESASPAAIKRVHKKTRHGVLRMLSVVTLTFLVSWLPLYLIFIYIRFFSQLSGSITERVESFIPFAQWLCESNSCYNPILYAFLNKKLRDAFRSLISSSTNTIIQNHQTPITHSTSTIHFHSRTPTFRYPISRL